MREESVPWVRSQQTHGRVKGQTLGPVSKTFCFISNPTPTLGPPPSPWESCCAPAALHFPHPFDLLRRTLPLHDCLQPSTLSPWVALKAARTGWGGATIIGLAVVPTGVGRDGHSTGILHARAQGTIYPASLTQSSGQASRVGGVSLLWAALRLGNWKEQGYTCDSSGQGIGEPDRRRKENGRETEWWNFCQVASPEKASTIAEGQGLLTLQPLNTVAFGDLVSNT